MPIVDNEVFFPLAVPWLGFGTAGLGEVTERATSWALEAGYRSFRILVFSFSSPHSNKVRSFVVVYMCTCDGLFCNVGASNGGGNMPCFMCSKCQGGQGCRLIDSAQATEWYNEKAVGRAIRSSSIRRDELFLVSKVT